MFRQVPGAATNNQQGGRNVSRARTLFLRGERNYSAAATSVLLQGGMIKRELRANIRPQQKHRCCKFGGPIHWNNAGRGRLINSP
jgi:hypothetical protein